MGIKEAVELNELLEKRPLELLVGRLYEGKADLRDGLVWERHFVAFEGASLNDGLSVGLHDDSENEKIEKF